MCNAPNGHRGNECFEPALMAAGEGINDAEGGEPLFSLAAVKGRGAVGRVAEQATPDEMMASSDDDAGADANASGPGGDQPAADDADDECAYDYLSHQ